MGNLKLIKEVQWTNKNQFTLRRKPGFWFYATHLPVFLSLDFHECVSITLRDWLNPIVGKLFQRYSAAILMETLINSHRKAFMLAMWFHVNCTWMTQPCLINSCGLMANFQSGTENKAYRAITWTYQINSGHSALPTKYRCQDMICRIARLIKLH